MASLDCNQCRHRTRRHLLAACFTALMAVADPAAQAQQGVVAAAALTQAPQDPAYPTLVLTALDAALERAVQVFHAGRYENNAATLRASDQTASAGDYHFFIGPDGKTRTEPALGMEGVRSAASTLR